MFCQAAKQKSKMFLYRVNFDLVSVVAIRTV